MTTNPPEPPGEPGAEQRHPTEEVPSEQMTSEGVTEPASSTASFGAPPPPPTQGPEMGPGADSAQAPSGNPPPTEHRYEAPRQESSRLQRSSSDRMLTGVCGGLGRHTGVDPILFRIGFVALVFAAGTGILLYLALAVLMPREDGQQIWSRAAGQRAGTGGSGDYGPPVATQPPGYWPPPPPPGPKAPRSPMPGVTVALLLIGLGVIALGSRYGGWSLDPSIYFAIAVAAVGIALLVTALGPWQRSKVGLITLGLFLSFGLFVTSALDSRGGFDEASFGERNYRPSSVEQLRDTYQVLMGQGTLDLSDLQFSTEDPTEIKINVTMGNFEILVPPDTDVRLNGDAVFGSVSAFGDPNIGDGYYPAFGENQARGQRDTGPGDEPELVLDVDVRFGNAEVTRVR